MMLSKEQSQAMGKPSKYWKNEVQQHLASKFISPTQMPPPKRLAVAVRAALIRLRREARYRREIDA